MEYIAFIIGILGLIASIVGMYFTYISFVNPMKRFKKYLKYPKKWEKFEGINQNIACYRYRKYPNYQIIIDWNNPVVTNFYEKWINDYPDMENNASYYVRLEFNSIILEKELFVDLDGGRYFVPVPKRIKVQNKMDYYYDEIQIQLALIVGQIYFGSDIVYFAEHCKTKIRIEKIL